MKEVLIKVSDNNKYILKKIKRYLRHDKKYLIKLETDYKNNIDLSKIKEVVQAFNIKDIKKRYTYIYDTVCTYLDNEFQKKRICNFKNNECIAVRKGLYCNSNYGCCYGPRRGKCKNLVNNRCKIKSISCKLFTCRYLKKNNVKFLIKDIPLLNLFFNYRQKYLISYSIFVDKEEMIEKLIKLSKR